MGLEFLSGVAAKLLEEPQAPHRGTAKGAGFTAQVAIPDYDSKVEAHYGRAPRTFGSSYIFRHFGVMIEFATTLELRIHDEARRLNRHLREIIETFGPVLLRNAHLPNASRTADQRNVFSSLNFHVDRGTTQEDHYSLFWRDPFDPVQRDPRSSSTLILSNAAACLQARAEGQGDERPKSHYTLFEESEPKDLVGSVLFELPWSAPAGTGEIGLLDNRTVLHASYYARPKFKGYPISVRYLY